MTQTFIETSELHLKQFSSKNTLLVTNSLLQFLLLGIVDLFFMAFSNDDDTYLLSVISLSCALTLSIMLPANYENNRLTRGDYFSSSDIYNVFGAISAFTTFFALIHEISKRNTFLAGFIAFVIISLVKDFYSNRVDPVSRIISKSFDDTLFSDITKTVTPLTNSHKDSDSNDVSTSSEEEVTN